MQNEAEYHYQLFMQILETLTNDHEEKQGDLFGDYQNTANTADHDIIGA